MLSSKILRLFTAITTLNVWYKTACKIGSNVFVLIGIFKYLLKILNCITSSVLKFSLMKDWLCQFWKFLDLVSVKIEGF
jgi:hypothetical protein